MTTEIKKATGVWQGKKVEYQVVLVQVTNLLGGTRPWAKPFIGKERQAVKVIMPNHRPFYLDNEDGTGLHKLKKEGAMNIIGRSLGESKEIKVLPKAIWINKVNKAKTKEINEATAEYWKDK